MYNHVSEHCGLQRKTDYFPYNAFVRPFSCMSVGCNSIGFSQYDNHLREYQGFMES